MQLFDAMLTFLTTLQFVNDVYSLLVNGRISRDSVLSVNITSKSSAFLDLYAQGRVLALVEELRRSSGIQTEFRVHPTRIEKHLRSLGFFAHCEKNNIRYVLLAELEGQQPFDFAAQTESPRNDQLPPPSGLPFGPYWRCLVPLSSIEVPTFRTEREVASRVTAVVAGFLQSTTTALSQMDVSAPSLRAALSRLAFGVFSELLSNGFMHSASPNIIFAMTMSREAETGVRPHRPGITLRSGQDKFELLVMDTGRGVSSAVGGALNPSAPARDDYWTFTKWREVFRLSKEKEESLLQNIFAGNLAIRQGRKSEGLHELGRTVSWFGGLLNYFTGRTEVQVRAAAREEHTTIVRHLPKPHYLPGVIASAILPFDDLKVARLRAIAQPQLEREPPAACPCVLRRLVPLPKPLLGAPLGANPARRAELDAQRFIHAYEDLQTPDQKNGVLLQVDLKLCDTLNRTYFDNLLQELCKASKALPPSLTSHILAHIVFVNTPRAVIRSLRHRPCNSFLMFQDAYCLMLDETDAPHFLGLPRLTRKLYDLDDALTVALFSGVVTPSRLKTALALDDAVIEHMKTLLGGFASAILHFDPKYGEGGAFYACDLQRALTDSRKHDLSDLEKYRIPSPEGTAFRLRNGTCVNGLLDFRFFWSNSERLVAASTLMLKRGPMAPIDTLVSFAGNGDRLASCIQRFSGTPSLVILDVEDPEPLRHSDLAGNCIMVVDVLYPGDENGYIANTIQHCKDDPRANILQVWTFCDLRDETRVLDPAANCGVPPLRDSEVVVTIQSPDVAPIQKVASQGLTALRNVQRYYPPLPPRRISNQGPIAALAESPSSYNAVELSTEFWQNASALGVVDLATSGRDKRSLLFYENNELLLRHPRLRSHVMQFVSDFVKHRLGSDVDVIVHPNHPVGAHLAALVAAHLPTNPVILPLLQVRYGETIELTLEQYSQYQRAIEEIRAPSGRQRPRVLIIDDSILTGSSVFTMLGVAIHLSLEPVGIMVLLNRLSPELSYSISWQNIPFGYMYRLRMPPITLKDTPSYRLTELNRQVLGRAPSYFAALWGKEVWKPDHLLVVARSGDASSPPTVDRGAFDSVVGEHIETYYLRQILFNLLLHPDGSILDLTARLAVGYNFLDLLVREGAFWRLLSELCRQHIREPQSCQSILLLRGLIYLICFSRCAFQIEVYQAFIKLCVGIVEDSMRTTSTMPQYHLVTDCVTALGVLGSEQLGAIALPLIRMASGSALDRDGPAILPLPDGGTVSEAPGKIRAARALVGSVAWSLGALLVQKGMDSLGGGLSDLNVSALANESLDRQLLLIDVLGSWIRVSNILRESAGIEASENLDLFLEDLRRDEGGMLSYLSDAPGYTCTLKSILHVCKGDTVVMYTSNGIEPYIARAIEASADLRPTDKIRPDDWLASSGPERLQRRMEDSLFYFSSDPEEVSFLDKFVQGRGHLWSLGGPVAVEGSTKYYVVVGYRKQQASVGLVCTAYYYWLSIELRLRGVLRSIHSKHVDSSTAWNALVQSLRPLHPVRFRDDAGPLLKKRQRVLLVGMATIDLGDLLRRAVGVSVQAVRSLTRVRSDIDSAIRTFLDRCKAGTAFVEGGEGGALSAHAKRWNVPPITDLSDGAYDEDLFALNRTVLEFILHECLCNALSYCKDVVELAFDVDRIGVTGFRIVVTVKNDRDDSEEGSGAKTETTGLEACRAAAFSVGGVFSSAFLPAEQRWVASLKLPLYRVPPRLRGYLRELFSEENTSAGDRRR